MSEIILPAGAGQDEKTDDLEVIDYKATEDDEERFFLIYHMRIQPSETEALDPKYRKWLIARFIMQKNMEREAIQQHRLMQQLGPSLKV